MSFREPPRRFRLTPLPHELDPRPVEVPKPNLLERLRQRRAPRPLPKTRTEAFVLLLRRAAIETLLAAGATLLIALAGGWLHHGALSRTFYVAGVVVLLPFVGWASPRRAGNTYVRSGESPRSRTPPLAVLPVGLVLIAIGILADSLR